MGNTRVDGEALRVAAGYFEQAADGLDGAVRAQFGAMRFDGSAAGCQHAFRGAAVHDAVAQLGVVMMQWARAAGDIAAALRGAAGSYEDADQRLVGKVL